jgi:ppGpp synthetase/RelA/SpoT-type nucleotidyltranferase
VHYRVKEPEHLVEKIIRRALGERTLRVSVYNYLDAIDDLIGFRALHLFKDDWPSLNTFIARNFRVLGPPRAIVYPTDPEDVLMMFRENGCLIDTRQTGYRSVHYSVVVNCRTKDLIAELQIRTLFEQAWGEVSHQIEYPYLSSVPLLRRYTSVLSEFAGCADHLASAARIVAQIAETNRRNPKDRKRRIRALQTRLGQKLNNILNNSPSVHRLLLNPAEVSPEALRGYTRRRPK